jgi:long-chain acyl-CoA synthetase
LKLGIDVRHKLFATVHKSLGGGIRMIITGAAAISPETANFYNDIGLLLIQGYGLSETAPVLSAENPTHMRLGSVGKAIPCVEVKIHEADSKGIGEIIAKGPNVMLGYMDEESPIYDGWFHTGDIGYIDRDGYIFICGRKKNVIVLPNGENVFPEETESKLNDIDGVLESVVVMTGEKSVIGAVIVYDPELTTTEAIDEAVAEINKTLVEFKKIRTVEYRTEEFIKTSTGKIKRDKI